MDFEKQLEAMRRRHVLHIDDETDTSKGTEATDSLPIPAIGNVFLYQEDNDNVSVSVYFYEETFWMNQKALGELFGTTKQSISYHLNNIFADGELLRESVVKEFLTTAADGKQYRTLHYNLDTIISVGYRVNSKKATKFRQWATKTLKEYMIKGFVINDDMLKNGKAFGQDYFDELLERIKEIRASERRFYQKITDIYSQCSYDYDSNSVITQTFFKTVQNKLIFAVTQKTAPEIIHSRADSSKENMGLTSWKNSPDGKILKSDVTVSKNYLTQEEISNLNDIVVMYLDYAENQAKRNKLMSMQDWVDKLDSFLKFNEYDILYDSGRISREVADKLAYKEYETFRVIQDTEFVSDFDKIAKRYSST